MNEHFNYQSIIEIKNKHQLIAISYSKAADLIMGIKCTKCPQKQFNSKHEVYGHVLESHLSNVQDEVINQNDMAGENMEGVEEEIPQKEIEPSIQVNVSRVSLKLLLT